MPEILTENLAAWTAIGITVLGAIVSLTFWMTAIYIRLGTAVDQLKIIVLLLDKHESRLDNHEIRLTKGGL